MSYKATIDEIKLRIEFKRQLIEITKSEIEALEDLLRDQEAQARKAA